MRSTDLHLPSAQKYPPVTSVARVLSDSTLPFLQPTVGPPGAAGTGHTSYEPSWRACGDQGHLPDFAGKVAIVTGAASGIGRACAAHLAALGARVLLIDQSVSVEALANELPRGVGTHGMRAGPNACLRADVALDDTSAQALSITLSDWGRLDAVVFSAGTSSTGYLRELQNSDVRRAIETNLLVHVGLSRALLRAAADKPLAPASLSLVYVVSKHSVAPSLGFGAYPLAKAAELQLMRLMALEGARHGIRANAVNPGAVFDGSKFWTESLVGVKSREHGVPPGLLESYYADRTLLGIRITPRDVARSVAFLASSSSVGTTGTILSVDGGLPTTIGR